MTSNRIDYLWQQYVTHAETTAERAELMEWVLVGDNEEKVKQLLDAARKQLSGSAQLTGEQSERIFAMIQQANHKVIPIYKAKQNWWKRVAVAAVVLLCIGAGGYFLFFNKKDASVAEATTTLPADVKPPQTNRATITLANGSKIYLDSNGNGQLATQGNIQLVKLADGRVAYQTSSGEVIKEMQYNTLYNPRGSKVIDMILSDGSHVWLNAGSSVTYPVAFIGAERRVQITGEAYFEITHNAKMPFNVVKGGMEVQVLGTHFNVNAYDDEEAIKVTLLEGSVKVKSEVAGQKSEVRIKPGEQAVLSIPSPLTLHHSPDLEAVMAWKNGLFNFNKSNLQTVMNQLARWYDIDIKYEGAVPQRIFRGEITRDLRLQQVLQGLEDVDIHFRIEGRTLVVLP